MTLVLAPAWYIFKMWLSVFTHSIPKELTKVQYDFLYPRCNWPFSPMYLATGDLLLFKKWIIHLWHICNLFYTFIAQSYSKQKSSKNLTFSIYNTAHLFSNCVRFKVRFNISLQLNIFQKLFDFSNFE